MDKQININRGQNKNWEHTSQAMAVVVFVQHSLSYNKQGMVYITMTQEN